MSAEQETAGEATGVVEEFLLDRGYAVRRLDPAVGDSPPVLLVYIPEDGEHLAGFGGLGPYRLDAVRPEPGDSEFACSAVLKAGGG